MIMQISNQAILLFMFLLMVVIFLPPLALPCILFLLFIRYDISESNKKILFSIIMVLVAFLFFASNSSEANIIYQESDFVSYYNNYLIFLKDGFLLDGFEYSQGLEFALPLLNYFLSFVLNSSNPFTLKLIYVLLQVYLLVLLLFSIKKKHSLTMSELFLLAACTIIFIKFGALQNHLRQGFSSLLLLIAIFSSSWRSFLYFSLACSFHLSALVIYPLVNVIINGNKLKIPLKSLFLISSLLFVLFSNVIINYISLDTPVIGKLIWSFLRFTDEAYIIEALKISLVNVVFFTILLLFSKNSGKNEIVDSIKIILVFSISLGFIPGFSRILSPIYNILMGYYFWLVFYYIYSAKLTKIVLIIFFIIYQVKWVYSDLYYFDFKDENSFLYIYNRIFDDYSDEKIDRQNLPRLKDVIDD